jgi:methylthioribose-1-phosphate isomerase
VHSAQAIRSFRSAGRTLLSFGLVKRTEGNLSVWDGHTLLITRTGCSLGALSPEDLIAGPLVGDPRKELAHASSDLEVHRLLYGARGPGAIVHAHPLGTVVQGEERPGEHGVYVFGPSLQWAVEEAVRQARGGAIGTAREQRAMPDVRPIQWLDGSVRILDQRKLPEAELYIHAVDPEQVGDAIQSMAVRGAPLLGIAAGYAMALAAVRSSASTTSGLLRDLEQTGRRLRASRPTAVNIGWAVDRLIGSARRSSAAMASADAVRHAVIEESALLALEDEASCAAIGRFGNGLVPDRSNILTHCNTGALATGGIGTAQGVILQAHRSGKRLHIWVDETRPVLQGARLTAWELQRCGIPMTLIADTAAGSLMAQGLVNMILVGADRIAANGDVANKVGTYQLAILARHHRIPFYVAAPLSTVDTGTAKGADIVIEDRDQEEVTGLRGVTIAPAGTPSVNPAFDVTPAELVTAIITDRGVARRPFGPALRRLGRAPAPRPTTDDPLAEALL